jgi:hypothetical protein
MTARALWTVYAGLWRRVRQVFLLALAGTAAAYAIVWLANAQGLRPKHATGAEDFTIVLLILGVSGVVGAAGVLLANSDTERLTLALPERVLRMPLGTWKLAMVHLVFGVSVSALLALAATLPAFYVLKVDLVWWMPVAAASAATPLVQLWAYTMGNAGLRPALASFIFYFGGLAWLVQRPMVIDAIKHGGARRAVLFILFFGVVYLLLWAVTRVQRGGGWAASLPRRGLEAATPKARRPFGSARGAQFWFEWRQYGMLMPAYVGGAAAAYFLGMPLVVGVFRMTDVTGKSSGEPLFRIDWLTSAQYIWMGLFLASFLGSILVGGVMLMRGGHWNSASSYLLTRPLSVSRISNARLLVLGAGAMSALVVILAITGAIEGVVHLQGESTGLGFFLHQGYEVLPLSLTVAMHFGFLLVLMWACAWPVGFVFALGGFALLILPMLGIVWGSVLVGLLEPDAARAQAAEWSPLLNWIAAGLVVGGLLILAWLAERRRYVHPVLPLLGAGLWLVYSWGFVHFVNRWEVPAGVKDWYVRFPHPVNWPLWVAVSVVPLLPFFLHPLMMARIRHR